MDPNSSDDSGDDEAVVQVVETSFSEKSKTEQIDAHFYYYAHEHGLGVPEKCPFGSKDFIGLNRYSESQLIEMTGGFSEERFIQVTEDGKLYHGNIKQESGGVNPVTVKTWGFTRGVNQAFYKNARRFYNEVQLLTSESFKSNPTLVDVLGVCVERKLAVVYNTKFHKSLREVISSPDFGWGQRIKVAAQLAELLRQLHNELYVLCVFNSWCIMVDESDDVKLFDLDHVRRVKGIDRKITVTVLTRRMNCYAPECLKKGYYSTATDVFSFGCLFVELIAEHTDYYDHKALLERWYDTRAKMTYIPVEVDSLVQNCLLEDPQSRPRMGDVCKALEEIMNHESSKRLKNC